MTPEPDPQLAAEIEAALALLEAEHAVWRAEQHLAQVIQKRGV